jgi:hypothetical protein
MSMVSYFKTLGQIEDRVTARMTELRQAERDVALHCNGMACDAAATAEDVYRAGLDHIGVPRRETAGLSASALRTILKNVRAGSYASHAPAMAFDASQDDGKLSSILAGVEPPKNLSTRSDFR